MDGSRPDPIAPEERLAQAVHRAEPLSKEGLLERAFTFLFGGLVYPQIWEDPEVDIAALALGPGKRIVAIASGGCNLMTYLTADPEAIEAVDLNPNHVALVRLKIAAARHLPTHAAFFRMFGLGAHPENPAAYRLRLRDHLDPETRAYWDGRDGLLRRRIDLFRRGLYREGLLGRFIATGHQLARVFGVRLADFTETPDAAAQKALFDEKLAPLFDSRLIRRLTAMKASLFGLGIPPAQYESLANAGGGDMARVLKDRLERLACGWPMAENYFAWQAFARGYAPGDGGPLPLYLQRRHWEAVRARAERISIANVSMTEKLAADPEGRHDGYLLLDAQDWMTDAQLNDLWRQITRTAAPGARVVFRTADEPSLLPGRLDDAILSRWRYDAEASARFTAADRSAIYGGVHLYHFEG
ncbi:MAG: DUF3419 family protein [Rhodobacteraceae bacterium]|nr:MAG: DUF3419 family protein [Paracoccaceae bacterium]